VDPGAGPRADPPRVRGWRCRRSAWAGCWPNWGCPRNSRPGGPTSRTRRSHNSLIPVTGHEQCSQLFFRSYNSVDHSRCKVNQSGRNEVRQVTAIGERVIALGGTYVSATQRSSFKTSGKSFRALLTRDELFCSWSPRSHGGG
jgi:hypothetical protein